jgi:hypothetical protein
VSGSLVADLGVGPDVWLILTLLGCVTLFFKFSRVWSVRNLDLLLLFAPAPGLMMLVGQRSDQPWVAFFWLFQGLALWLARCLIDLGMTRRPLLEPNLNAAGLACLAIGILGLSLAESVSLPVDDGAARNPADPGGRVDPPPAGSLDANAPVNQVLKIAPLPNSFKANMPQVMIARVLASVGQLGLVAALIVVGWKHFGRPTDGLSVATCYLLLPYTRIALVDCGQIVPSAMIVTAIAVHDRPRLAGALIGLAGGWMPACLGLVPLWGGYYRGRGAIRFVTVATGAVAGCLMLSQAVPGLAGWARALGARSLAEAGLLPRVAPPLSGSFWSGIDASYRLPVQILYLAFVVTVALLPASKNLGDLIALSASLLVAGQFWYLDKGGTLMLLYLPLVLLMIFRPNLASRRQVAPPPKGHGVGQPLNPVR